MLPSVWQTDHCSLSFLCTLLCLNVVCLFSHCAHPGYLCQTWFILQNLLGHCPSWSCLELYQWKQFSAMFPGCFVWVACKSHDTLYHPYWQTSLSPLRRLNFLRVWIVSSVRYCCSRGVSVPLYTYACHGGCQWICTQTLAISINQLII